jgi:Zn-dependent protease with chaperone function
VVVALRVENGWLIVESAAGEVVDRERLDRAAVSELFDHAPRLVSLPNGATLEVRDPTRSFARALEAAGVRPSPAARLQRWWPGALMALAALVALLMALYFKGLPAAARWAAFALPPRLEARMGEELMAVLDKHHLQPSHLDVSKRAQISDRFARAAAAVAPNVSYRLEFRKSKAVVNAMALPGGIIVLLDGLVDFAADEDAVLGVLGHELGHVAHKHAARGILQSIGVGPLAGLLWGDFSSVAASVPITLGVLRFSREFEHDADEFAIGLLRSQHIPMRPLYEFFIRLRETPSGRTAATVPDFLSTHPPTEERLERLQREMRNPTSGYPFGPLRALAQPASVALTDEHSHPVQLRRHIGTVSIAPPMAISSSAVNVSLVRMPLSSREQGR